MLRSNSRELQWLREEAVYRASTSINNSLPQHQRLRSITTTSNSHHTAHQAQQPTSMRQRLLPLPKSNITLELDPLLSPSLLQTRYPTTKEDQRIKYLRYLRIIMATRISHRRPVCVISPSFLARHHLRPSRLPASRGSSTMTPTILRQRDRRLADRSAA